MRREIAALRALVGELEAKPEANLPAVTPSLNGDAAALLVTALLQAQESAARQEARMRVLEKRLTRIRSRNRRLNRERDTMRARLGTLEEVIAALHGNLSDLRLAQASATISQPTPLIGSLPLRRQAEAGMRSDEGVSLP